MSKIQTTGLSFEIVDGVEASKMRPEWLAWNEHASTWLKPGEVGCYMGHLRVLQRVVDYNLPYACVLEDDFCFEAAPEFRLGDLESNLPENFHYIHLQRDLQLNPKYKIVATERCYWRIAQTPLCSTGYVIERSLAQFVLEHHAVCTMPIDHLYAELSYRGRFYQTIKPLIGIEPGLVSSIQTNEFSAAQSLPKRLDKQAAKAESTNSTSG